MDTFTLGSLFKAFRNDDLRCFWSLKVEIYQLLITNLRTLSRSAADPNHTETMSYDVFDPGT